MMTGKQRSELMQAYRKEPLCVLGTVLKCAAALLMIGGLALIGSAGEPAMGPVSEAQDSFRYSG